MKFILIMKLVLVIAGLIAFCWGEQQYVVENEHVEHFDGQAGVLVDFSNLMTMGRKRLFNGSFTFHKDMDDSEFSFGVEIYASPAADGNYQRIAMGIPPTPICVGMKKFHTEFLQPSMEHGVNTNFPYVPPDEGLCPMPAGTFYMKELSFKTESWPNQVPRGAVKAVVTFFKSKLSVGGVIIIVKIEDI